MCPWPASAGVRCHSIEVGFRRLSPSARLLVRRRSPNQTRCWQASQTVRWSRHASGSGFGEKWHFPPMTRRRRAPQRASIIKTMTNRQKPTITTAVATFSSVNSQSIGFFHSFICNDHNKAGEILRILNDCKQPDILVKKIGAWLRRGAGRQYRRESGPPTGRRAGALAGRNGVCASIRIASGTQLRESLGPFLC